jgi:CheY-like chemotaxis protein
MTLDKMVQWHQLSPTPEVGQSQLWILVSFYVLLRHNLFLLRSYRNDYVVSVRQKLNFLPQGVGNASSNPARDRMLTLAEKILEHLRPEAGDSNLAPSAQPELPNQSLLASRQSQPLAARADACASIAALVAYLKDASSASSQVCNLFDICNAAIRTCQPLLKDRSVDLKFMGRRRWLPLRVLLVDDNAFVLKCLQRILRNRGYYYESCADGESCVKAFEASLLSEPNAYNRFDLILMDKEMPTCEHDGYRLAGVGAVKKIRELSQLQMLKEPRFRCPCIIGNSACTDEDDPTLIRFCSELELARQQAGMPTNLLVHKGKISSWSDAFDLEVRQLCGLHEEPAPQLSEAQDAPTVWGKPIRLQMIFCNLITNAIQHGKPADGEHCVSVSYDVIDRRSRVHPCLMRSDLDDEVERSLSWKLSGAFRDDTQRFVQVMVTDNGPGIDVNNERMKRSLGFRPSSDISDGASVQAGSPAAAVNPAVSSSDSCVSNFGIGLQRIVCPEVANSHGAMGVHSRIDPDKGCSFVVALPHCAVGVRSQNP